MCYDIGMARNRLIANLISMRTLTPRAWWRLTLILAMTLAYGAIFFPLQYFWGDIVSLLVLVPVVLSGWSFGPVFGLIYSVIAWGLDGLLWGLSGKIIWDSQFGFLALAMLVTFVLIGYLSGRLSLAMTRRFLLHYAPEEAPNLMEQNRLPGSFESSIVSLVNFMSTPAFAINQERRIVAWNQGMEALTGLRIAEILGKPSIESTLLFYGSRRPHLVDCLIQNPDRIQMDFPGVRQDGLTQVLDVYLPRLKPDGVYLKIKASPLFDLDGNLVGAVQSMQDITESRLEQERDGKAGKIDTVTGLFTPEAFKTEIGRLETARVCPTSILLVKLHSGNQKLTHIEDFVKRSAPFIQSVFRLNDTIAYLGEGEIAVLLPRADSKVAQQIADRLRKALSQGKTNREDTVVQTNVVAVTCQETGAIYETFQQGRQVLKNE